MVECLPAATEPIAVVDYLTANWFTPWTKTPGMVGHVDCSQVLTGRPEHIDRLSARLEEITQALQTRVRLRPLARHGTR